MPQTAMQQLYELHSPEIEAHCCRLLGHSADATAAVHETFVRALTRGRAPSNADHMVRSLFRISTNVCIDVLRQRSVRRRAVPELAAHAVRTRSVDAPYDARQSLERVLSHCDDTTRSSVSMRFIDGRGRGEIAQTLGTTRRTVFNRLKRLERLANELVAEG